MISNRILIVEDDKAISDFISINLIYTGYECVILDDGKKAAEYIEQRIILSSLLKCWNLQ